MTRLSASEETENAIRLGTLALMTPVMTSTEGRCVARTRWMPTARAICAMRTTDSSTSRAATIIRSLSSSTTMTMKGSGSNSSSSPSSSIAASSSASKGSPAALLCARWAISAMARGVVGATDALRAAGCACLVVAGDVADLLGARRS